MTTDHPEFEWIRAYQKGDVSALEPLVEHFRKPLFSFIHGMLQGRGDAEEIFQEVWLRAIRNLGGFREKNFAGWLFRIAHNLFIDQVRREKKFIQPAADDPSESTTPMIERLADAGLGPDRLTATRDLGARILAAVSALPEEQREVFMMRTEGDVPFKEIARIQGTNLNTALARMQYALQKLRPLLQEEYDGFRGRT